MDTRKSESTTDSLNYPRWSFQRHTGSYFPSSSLSVPSRTCPTPPPGRWLPTTGVLRFPGMPSLPLPGAPIGWEPREWRIASALQHPPFWGLRGEEIGHTWRKVALAGGFEGHRDSKKHTDAGGGGASDERDQGVENEL